MNLKRTLIETLPPGVKRLLAVPYDYYQTRQADPSRGKIAQLVSLIVFTGVVGAGYLYGAIRY